MTTAARRGAAPEGARWIGSFAIRRRGTKTGSQDDDYIVNDNIIIDFLPDSPCVTKPEDILHVDRFVDISEEARREGFLAPVAVSRTTYYTVFNVWSSCACPSCEESARNATRDRIQRALRQLIEVLRVADPKRDLGIVSFVLDVPETKARGRSVRRVLPLRAEFGEPDSCHPVVTILEQNEFNLQAIDDLGPPPKEP